MNQLTEIMSWHDSQKWAAQNGLHTTYHNNEHVWDGQYRAQYATTTTPDLSNLRIDNKVQFHTQLNKMRDHYGTMADLHLCEVFYPVCEKPVSLFNRLKQRITRNG